MLTAGKRANGKMVHCFLVLCGLPASGKSTLAQKLKTSELISKFHIVVLSYDDLMPDNLKEFLTDNRKLSAEVKQKTFFLCENNFFIFGIFTEIHLSTK